MVIYKRYSTPGPVDGCALPSLTALKSVAGGEGGGGVAGGGGGGGSAGRATHRQGDESARRRLPSLRFTPLSGDSVSVLPGCPLSLLFTNECMKNCA